MAKWIKADVGVKKVAVAPIARAKAPISATTMPRPKPTIEPVPTPDMPTQDVLSPDSSAIPAELHHTTITPLETKMEKITQTTEELVSFSQANVEAIVKSSQIWAAGVQDIGKTFAATAQAQMDATMATLKAFTGVKSFKDAIELQTNLARSSVGAVVAETGKLTDASMKLAEQTFAPITARVNVAMEKFSKAA
jgi:phasin family protein